jgi:TonB-dependent SusC/RagA subfamily outer membrane receptor
MPALFLFLFKVNMALVLFCIGYYMVLRHLTFYTLNRIYLVTAIIFSTLYPKINLSDFVQRQLTEPVQTVILRWEAPAKNLVKPLYQPNYWQWVEVIFWAGVILFAARMIVQLFSLLRLYRRSQPGQIDEHKVRLLKDDIGPFSFWRDVYVNPTKLSPAELKNALQHEQIHVSQWHTLDLLLAELSTIFYWFNPGVWLMKRAVRENLEFITDRKILQKGVDSREYQYSLVSVSLATMPNTIVNHFNISTIKKRIIMMNAKKSSGYNITRYIFLVPAVVVLLLTFSLSKAEVAKHTIKSIATAISHVVIVGNGDNLNKKSTNTIAGTKSALAKVSVKKMNISADTIYSGKAKNGRKSFMVTSNTKADSVNYVLNGQKSTKEEVKALNPERIKSIELLNAKSAKEFYPELDNDREVMFVTTDDSEAGKKLKEKMDKVMGDGTLAGDQNMSISGSPDVAPAPARGTGTAYAISSSADNAIEVEGDTDGSKNISAVTVTGVAPVAKVKSMTYVKKNVSVSAKPSSDVAITLDAPEVVNVTSSDKIIATDSKIRKVYVKGFKGNSDQLTIDGDGQPLFIIDGKEAKSLKNISPADIKSISVLKDGTAEKKYGEKGKNGVVEITTKKK